MHIYYNPLFILIPLLVFLGVVIAVQLGQKIAKFFHWYDNIGVTFLILICELLFVMGFFVHPC